MYGNFWGVYIFRATLATSMRPNAKTSTVLDFTSRFPINSSEHLVAFSTIDARWRIPGVLASLPSVPCVCEMLLTTSVLLTGPVQPQAALHPAGILSVLHLSSDFFSHPTSSLFRRKITNSFPWHWQSYVPLPKALGLRLYPSPWPGGGSGAQLTVYLQALLKVHFPHQESFVLEELSASC